MNEGGGSSPARKKQKQMQAQLALELEKRISSSDEELLKMSMRVD